MNHPAPVQATTEDTPVSRAGRPLLSSGGLGLFLLVLTYNYRRLGLQRPEWCLMLPGLQLVGMFVIWRWKGRPTSLAAWWGWSLINAGLVGSAIALWDGWFDTAIVVLLAVLLKASLLGAWGCVIVRVTGWLVRMVRSREQRRFRILSRNWSIVLGLLVLAECVSWLEPWQARPQPITLPQTLSDPPADELHVCAVGGSTMMGFPYEPRFGIPHVITWHLKRCYPRRRIVLHNLAFGGLSLQQSLQELQYLPHRPHLLLLYTGHTEFYHELEETNDFSRGPLEQFDPLLDWSPLYRLANRWVLQQPALKKLYPPRGRTLVDHRLVHPFQLEVRLKRFRSRLRELAEFCRDMNIASLWYVPAGSESGFAPNRSVSAAPPDASHTAFLQRIYERSSQEQRRGEWKLAVRTLSDGLVLEPKFAEFHFQLGRCLQQLGQFDQARGHFQVALENDGHPVRADVEHRRTVAEVATQYEILLVDTPELLRPHTPHGILDESLFHDNVHPTLKGFFLMGSAGAERLRESRVLEQQFGPSAEVSIARFETALADLNVDRKLRSLACQRIAQGLTALSLMRFDPAGRERESKRYSQRARMLKLQPEGPPADTTPRQTPEMPAPGVPGSAGGC